MKNNIELLAYSDYREYLNDYFTMKKKIKTSFSKRYFAQKAGFSDHSQLNQLLNGRRNATDKSLQKLLKGLGLVGNDKEYFETLVKFTQAKTNEEKEACFLKLNAIRKTVDVHKVTIVQHQYFDKWFYPVVLEIAQLDIWENDFKKLGKLIRPIISEKDAKEAIDLLVKIDMLYKKNGRYYKPQNVVVPGDIATQKIRLAMRNNIKMGMHASDEMTPEERNIISYGFMVSEGNKKKYDALIEEFQEKLNALVVNESGDPECMYQCNLQFFPMTSKFYQKEK